MIALSANLLLHRVQLLKGERRARRPHGERVWTAVSLRARKRQETLRRIAETGLRLFGERGYSRRRSTPSRRPPASRVGRSSPTSGRRRDPAGLQMRGSARSCARRCWPSPTRRRSTSSGAPCCTWWRASATQEFISIDRVLRANETLQARKQATYGLHERALHEALVERWPDPPAARPCASSRWSPRRDAAGDRGLDPGRRRPERRPVPGGAFAQIRAEVCGHSGTSRELSAS